MTRTIQSLAIADLSDFAKLLQRQLDQAPNPGHLSLLNMLARAAGFQNYQHLRAQNLAVDSIALKPEIFDQKRVEMALRYFDAKAEMHSWPAKTQAQHLCLWGLWSRLPARVQMTERQLSAALNDWHHFKDAAIIRRTLVEIGLLSRTLDCTSYLRCERAPPPEAAALTRILHQRRA